MQRPGRDQADPPVPAPWAAVQDGRPDAGGNGPPSAFGVPSDATPGGYGRPDGPGGAGGYGQPGGYGGADAPAQPGGYGAAGPGGPGGWPPPARASVWPPSRREVLTALGTIAALAVLGAALAPLWVQLAPRLAFQVDRPGRALPVVPEAEEYVAADGRFVLITLAAGVVAGLVCWLLRASRGPLLLVALAAGGLLGAVVTWQLGLRLAPGYRPEELQEVGRIVYQPLELVARAALVVEPVAAVLVYLLAVGFSARNDLGRPEPAPAQPVHPAPPRPVSSDSG